MSLLCLQCMHTMPKTVVTQLFPASPPHIARANPQNGREGRVCVAGRVSFVYQFCLIRINFLCVRHSTDGQILEMDTISMNSI